jgi:N-acetylmuramoyl-L-alanine amidase
LSNVRWCLGRGFDRGIVAVAVAFVAGTDARDEGCRASRETAAIGSKSRGSDRLLLSFSFVAPAVATLLVPFLLLAGAEPAPFIVAIDPGHGGSNRGAPTKRAGYFEKHLTLALAKRIERLLAGEKDLKIVLCRRSDVLVPVRERVRCANEAGARLFLSLHANAAGGGEAPGSQRGFEIFVLPLDDVDKEVARVALLAKDDTEAAWAGHQVREAALQGLAAARRIEWRLADTLVRERDRGIKQEGATLDVLQGLDMPGLLVEVGFLDHEEEGPFLLSEEGQAAVAKALAGALTDLRSRERRGRKEPMTTAPRPGQAGTKER